jgi:hypothetical protein
MFQEEETDYFPTVDALIPAPDEPGDMITMSTQSLNALLQRIEALEQRNAAPAATAPSAAAVPATTLPTTSGAHGITLDQAELASLRDLSIIIQHSEQAPSTSFKVTPTSEEAFLAAFTTRRSELVSCKWTEINRILDRVVGGSVDIAGVHPSFNRAIRSFKSLHELLVSALHTVTPLDFFSGADPRNWNIVTWERTAKIQGTKFPIGFYDGKIIESLSLPDFVTRVGKIELFSALLLKQAHLASFFYSHPQFGNMVGADLEAFRDTVQRLHYSNPSINEVAFVRCCHRFYLSQRLSGLPLIYCPTARNSFTTHVTEAFPSIQPITSSQFNSLGRLLNHMNYDGDSTKKATPDSRPAFPLPRPPSQPQPRGFGTNPREPRPISLVLGRRISDIPLHEGREVCFKWNIGACRFNNCIRAHVCAVCKMRNINPTPAHAARDQNDDAHRDAITRVHPPPSNPDPPRPF